GGSVLWGPVEWQVARGLARQRSRTALRNRATPTFGETSRRSASIARPVAIDRPPRRVNRASGNDKPAGIAARPCPDGSAHNSPETQASACTVPRSDRVQTLWSSPSLARPIALDKASRSLPDSAPGRTALRRGTDARSHHWASSLARYSPRSTLANSCRPRTLREPDPASQWPWQ